jgi:hypothetical protein
MTQTVNRTGFEQTNSGLWISKDIDAELVYTFDWSEWLEGTDTIASVDYEVAARRNDPDPLIKGTEGVTQDGLKTFVELKEGQLDKVYIVTARVTTANGLVDRRNFRVRVENRSA